MVKIDNMYYGSNSFTFQKAEELRKHMTKAELILWEELRNKKLLGLKFRRQHPISRFIADFYCHKHKLVIELDGEIHLKNDVAINDKKREDEIKSLGITVLRFKNNEIINHLESVLQQISNFCNAQ
ncbi:MAG: endonuclease domain-containing protein [Bacteroidetes bacterium]|nr:endonuclease domain-containing protein [Bacteroidota bacterium]